MEAFKSVGSHLFGAFTKGAIQNLALQSEEDKRWQDYNYPPFIKLIHYSTQGLQMPFSRIVHVLNANVILVIGVQIINLVNCIVQISSDCGGIHGLSILYSFLNIMLMPMLTFFTFYKGYYAVCKGPGHASALTIFYIAQVVQLILFFIFTIIKCGLKFSLALAVFEIVLYYMSILMGIYAIISIKKNYGHGEPYKAAGYEMQNHPAGTDAIDDDRN